MHGQGALGGIAYARVQSGEFGLPAFSILQNTANLASAPERPVYCIGLAKMTGADEAHFVIWGAVLFSAQVRPTGLVTYFRKKRLLGPTMKSTTRQVFAPALVGIILSTES